MLLGYLGYSKAGREVRRERKFYNLDMILAVGYRVRSHVGTHFRKWATEVLTEYMKKGFVLNDERLKNPKEFGADFLNKGNWYEKAVGGTGSSGRPLQAGFLLRYPFMELVLLL